MSSVACRAFCLEIVLAKTHLNSTISTHNARHATLKIVNYYYGAPMTVEEYEYVRMSLNVISKEIVTQYELQKIAVNDWVYIEIRKGMPGLKQAGKIAHNRLKTHLEKYGY